MLLAHAERISTELARGSAQEDWRVRLVATEALCRELIAASPYDVLANLSETLLDPLRAQLLDGRAQIVAQTCAAIGVAAAQLGPDGGELADALLPLLIDLVGCSTAAGSIGLSAHRAACAVLLHVPAYSVLAPMFVTLSSPTTTRAGRGRLAEQLLLLLRAWPAAPLRKRATLLAVAVARLCDDDCARTRRVARHAFLEVMEHYPRTATAQFGRLPASIQAALQATARERSRLLGPPAIPPPPAEPAAVCLQAAARGLLRRRESRRLATFVASLRDGGRLSVEGHAATLRWRGSCRSADGEWLGVELDQPLGRHSGALKGDAHFACQPKRGVYVRARAVEPVGGWPRRPPPAAARPPERPPPSTPTAAPPAAARPPPNTAPAQLERGAIDADAPPPPPPPVPPLKLLFASHRGVLQNMKQIVDGQLKLLSGHEIAAKLKGESLAQTYLQQMEALCKQQKLLASQLHDCIVPLLDRSA